MNILNKKSNIIIGLLSIVVVTPILIDKLIIKNKIFSHISNEGWVSFLGSYIGALISGVVSLVGILWTINYYKTQHKEEELNANFPVLQYNFYEFTYPVNIEGTKIVWGDSEDYSKEIVYVIEMKNVMDNVALNLRVEDIVSENIKFNHSIDWSYSVLQKNQQEKIYITFRIKNENELKISELKFKLRYSDKRNNWYECEFTVSIVRQNYWLSDGKLTHPIQATLSIGKPKHILYSENLLSTMFPILINKNKD